ncbi:MAG: STAS domain-containing protein [Prevotella sp.]|nr:STAS domain-containing protein [Prevotella sp.]MBQ6211251.1 STAS domain-containing protein [Prevotella sp.]
MRTIIQEQGDCTTAMFIGRFDTAAASIAEQEMQPLFVCSCPEITLDCSKLEYISSSGLRLFLGLLKSTKPKGIHLYITGLNDDLKQVFAMTGFNSLFEFK